MYAQEGLKVQSRRSGGHTVIGPDEHLAQPPEVGYPMRPVNDGEQYISIKVAFAYYDKCGDSIFFKYYPGFRAPSWCPRGDGGFLEVEVLPTQ